MLISFPIIGTKQLAPSSLKRRHLGDSWSEGSQAVVSWLQGRIIKAEGYSKESCLAHAARKQSKGTATQREEQGRQFKGKISSSLNRLGVWPPARASQPLLQEGTYSKLL